jgi:hypothetical protein
MCFGEREGILGAGSLEIERRGCPAREAFTETERNTKMSNQSENEVLPSQEVRLTPLSELETSQQAIAQLSDEQLMEIAGGVLPTREQVTTALKHVGIAAACCAAGAGLVAAMSAGVSTAVAAGSHEQVDMKSNVELSAKVGSVLGAALYSTAKGYKYCVNCTLNRVSGTAQVTPVGDVELGQHHG